LRPGELLRAVRAIDAEVLPRDVAAQARLLHHRGEEPVGDLLAQEPLAILGERAVVETLGVHVEVEEVLEEQVVAQPFTELPLAANRVQGHQHRRLEQLLGRHALSTGGRVHSVELGFQLLQDPRVLLWGAAQGPRINTLLGWDKQ
jgi:hypothetical protein